MPTREEVRWIREESRRQAQRVARAAAAAGRSAGRLRAATRAYFARLVERGFDAAPGVREPLAPEDLPPLPASGAGPRAAATRRAPRAGGRPIIARPATHAAATRALSLPGFPRGVRAEVLSLEPRSGAATLRLVFARGATLPAGRSASDLELYLLAGAVTLGAGRRAPGSYLFVPRGVGLPALVAPQEATFLAAYRSGPPSFRAADSDHPEAERDRLVDIASVEVLDWQASAAGEAAEAGRLVKLLREDPVRGARTRLVALAPHYRRDAVTVRDAALERLVLGGRFECLQSLGTGRAGDYTWIPAHVGDGPWAAPGGALLLEHVDGEAAEVRGLDPATGSAAHRRRAVAALRRRRPALAAALAARG
ncbi:MAG: DUF4437 domain-containing protein [Proteobacteria bacterium]|nr:DUF4437 domain-containing protein [Pseudomonadota bacterium]